MYLFRPLKYITDVTESKSIQIMKIAQFIYNYYIKRDETLDICIVKLPSRASNNGRSTDNVWPDRGLDRSNSGLAGHFDRPFLDTTTLFSIQVLLNALNAL